MLKKFRNKLNKKHVLSGWMQICSAEIAEILSQKNFDSITLDLEHGSFDIHKLNYIFIAIESEKKISLVRLANHKTDDLGLIFDAGCSGIIIPNVSSPDEVKKKYDQFVWPPKGKEGLAFQEQISTETFLKIINHINQF